MNEFTAAQMRDGASGGPDLPEDFVRGLGRSWFAVLCAVAVGAFLGIAAGLVQPNVYSSTTKLYLRSGAREQLTSESVIGLEGEHLATPPTMTDEMQLLSDVANYRRVAEKLGPAKILEPDDPGRYESPLTPAPVRWMHQIQAGVIGWLARRREAVAGEADSLQLATKVLIEDTAISNELGSNVIAITHTSTSPERAREVAQALTDAFIARHREQFSIHTLVEASRSKLEEARKARDEAANAYVEYVNQSGLVDLDPRVPALTTEISALEKDLFDSRVRRKGIERNRAKLSGKLEGTPDSVEVVSGPTVLVPNEEYEDQLQYLHQLQQKKLELTSQNMAIPERERIARNYDREIDATRAKLKDTPRTVAQNPEVRENENLAHTTLSTKVEDLELEDQSLSVKVDSLEQVLEDKRKELADLRKEVLVATLKKKDLESTRESQDAAYKQTLSRFTALEALGNIEQHEDPNLRVLQAATFEPDKIGPKRFSLLVKGLLGGLLVGIAYAVLRRRFDRKLSAPETFERRAGVPVLGVIPDLPSLHRLRAG